MDYSVWDAIATIGSKYHRDTVELLAGRIASLSNMEEFPTIAKSLRNWIDPKDVDSIERACRRAVGEPSPSECAAALRSAAYTAERMKREQSVEMVWTGPSTTFVSTRHTERALMEIVANAERELFVVSFVAYNVEEVVKALRNAVERGVRVDILLESSNKHGGKVDIDSIRTFSEKIPEANLYVWNEGKTSEEGLQGSVHAKCAVCDGKWAFITSANLTKAAMERNMELGVLVKGGDLPKSLQRHLQALVDTKKIGKI